MHPSARLIGPVLLAEGARVNADAVIVGPATIGLRTQVAAGALVSRSFIWDDCEIGAGAIVDASVLADRCVVAAGERLKNVTQLPEDALPPVRQVAGAGDAARRPDFSLAAERFRTGFTGRVHVPRSPKAPAQ